MASLDTWILLENGPREPQIADAEEFSARMRQLFAERRRFASPPPRSLAGLRASMGISQEALGERLGVKQARVSRLERFPNPRLDVLRSYVAALGGELIVSASFPGRVVRLEVPAPSLRSG